MVPKTHKTPVALAAVVTFLALVAGMATIPTAQAEETPLAARRVATKFKKIHWPASPAVYGTPTYVNGKIKSKKRKKRVVVLQQKLPSGWQKVDKDKTNGKGRFHLKAKTNWYHKKIKLRVVVQAHPQGRGQRQQGPRLHRQPDLRAGRQLQRLVADRAGLQDPVQPVRSRALAAEHPVRARRCQARGEARAQAAQRGHRHPVRLRRQDQGDPGLEAHVARATPTWSSPGPPPARPSGPSTATRSVAAASSGRSYARTAKGKRALQITRSGLVLDNTFAAPGRVRRAQRPRLDHRPRARPRRRPRPRARAGPADVPLGRERLQRHLPGRRPRRAPARRADDRVPEEGPPLRPLGAGLRAPAGGRRARGAACADLS